ncbi:hypothetical protein [Demequina mangrovi]|uniref:Uncharacterized protein n=1 Tax=Demequina mangrovi TaxID=1043493 RepID=A0A1H6U4P2_9MICO|nr:hypothetical protein [Demequina mangrovi]SEI87309.1 hypothetical protein SAMN05421637_0260 [Demequina mangrovi]
MVTRRAALPMAVALLLAACAPSEPTEVRGPVAIIGWSNAGNEQIVDVDTCNGDPVAEVVETDTTVTITVTSTRRDPGDACLDIVRVELDADLGDRQVIDGVTGEEPPGIEG